MKDLNTLFSAAIRQSFEFKEALEIVNRNSSGKIWLIGGFVYRTIASQLYNVPKPDVDLDFIVEVPVQRFNLPLGWKVEKNKFDNPKLVNGKKQIDYVPLENINSILYQKIKPTIENYLAHVPLTVQALAYDVEEKKLIGDVGLKALKDRTVEVNDFHFAVHAARMKGKTITKMIKEKAESLGFKAILPE